MISICNLGYPAVMGCNGFMLNFRKWIEIYGPAG